MPDPQIEKLLIVQAHDIEVLRIENELARIPRERESLEKKIAAEEANVEEARSDLKAKEVLRNELDVEVKAKESNVQRFRTQQLEVKKNEEYRALTHQIEEAETEIAQLEEKEIGVMLEIDEATEAFESERGKIEERIALQRKMIDQLAERETGLQGSLDAERAKAQAARGDVAPDFLEHYERVRKATKRPPYVVPIENHKCGGCHLRVSNEVSRDAINHGEPHFCDQCSRMVYA